MKKNASAYLLLLLACVRFFNRILRCAADKNPRKRELRWVHSKTFLWNPFKGVPDGHLPQRASPLFQVTTLFSQSYINTLFALVWLYSIRWFLSSAHSIWKIVKSQKMNRKLLVLFAIVVLTIVISRTNAASVNQPFGHEIGKNDFLTLNFTS